MSKYLRNAAYVLLLFSCIALAQSPAPAPPAIGSAAANAHAPAPDQLTPQILGEMLRSATNFHELVRNLSLSKSFGPDQHVVGPDGQLHHPLERTAETLGAGAGVGAAIGAMAHSQNGILIGALVGGAGGLIIDQIVKHREDMREGALHSPTPDTSYAPSDHSQKLKRREHNPDQDSH